ncbi:transmembrane protein, putative (macronuclear) [Tetrahymena thermophila SB210]|uniref:Transmembrane protein, putative n=1 Tax=Tetrahymena thermophila (strain SB210) TaxID=312017 RepID=W7XAZ8_TETTS|nr:transmembrane protein, putative [Tetrahymena thermophila SB210]EWS74522.1 transmembrane protein, putative [Tetrahymena thermophila SB210]|eukprot:XP_012652952.1 transmembrane protein, putative [Tetrahymena thermophila SB210]
MNLKANKIQNAMLKKYLFITQIEILFKQIKFKKSFFLRQQIYLEVVTLNRNYKQRDKCVMKQFMIDAQQIGFILKFLLYYINQCYFIKLVVIYFYILRFFNYRNECCIDIYQFIYNQLISQLVSQLIILLGHRIYILYVCFYACDFQQSMRLVFCCCFCQLFCIIQS